MTIDMTQFIIKLLLATSSFFLFCGNSAAQIQTATLTFFTDEDETANQICYTPNGEMFVGGHLRYGDGPASIFLKKIDEPGAGIEVIWHKEYDNPDVVENLMDMVVAPDGNLFLLIEQRTGWGLGDLNSANILILKVDTEGEVIWDAFFDGGSKDNAVSLLVRPNGNLLVIGSSNSQTGNNFENDFLWLPINADGSLSTPKYLDVPAFSTTALTDAALAPDGGIYAISNYQVAKLDESGGVAWEKTIGEGITDAVLTDLLVLQDGSFLVTGGQTIEATESVDATIIRHDESGDFVWQQNYGDEGVEILEELIVCEEDGQIIGIGQNSPDDFNLIDGYYFLVTDMEGNEISSTTYGSNTGFREQGLDITHTTDGRVVAAGITTESGTGDVMLLFTPSLDFQCSPPSMVSYTEEIPQADIDVFPNPNSGDFIVKLDETAALSNPQFLLFDAFGKMVQKQKLTFAENHIHHIGLPPGIYFYRIHANWQRLGNGKIIVVEK